MGTGSSTPALEKSELEALREVTGLNPKELKRLYARFEALDTNGNQEISTAELFAQPDNALNPLLPRIQFFFDLDGSGTINFKEFVTTLLNYSTSTTHEERIRFGFALFDLDGDGYLTQREIFRMMKMMLGASLADDRIDVLSKSALRHATVQGLLSIDDFAALVSAEELEAKVTLRF